MYGTEIDQPRYLIVSLFMKNVPILPLLKFANGNRNETLYRLRRTKRKRRKCKWIGLERHSLQSILNLNILKKKPFLQAQINNQAQVLTATSKRLAFTACINKSLLPKESLTVSLWIFIIRYPTFGHSKFTASSDIKHPPSPAGQFRFSLRLSP